MASHFIVLAVRASHTTRQELSKYSKYITFVIVAEIVTKFLALSNSNAATDIHFVLHFIVGQFMTYQLF
jgi:hypothetical protein